MPRENSAGAVIFRIENNKRYYLLLHYHSGHWEFPKGHIEKGESNKETVKRETEEETGIKDIRIVEGFEQYIKYFFRQGYGLTPEQRKKAPWIFKLVAFYLAETNTKEVVISKEHIGFMWLPYEDAVKKLTYKNAKEILRKANEYIVEHKI